jgi:hypothetical protein
MRGKKHLSLALVLLLLHGRGGKNRTEQRCAQPECTCINTSDETQSTHEHPSPTYLYEHGNQKLRLVNATGAGKKQEQYK